MKFKLKFATIFAFSKKIIIAYYKAKRAFADVKINIVLF